MAKNALEKSKRDGGEKGNWGMTKKKRGNLVRGQEQRLY